MKKILFPCTLNASQCCGYMNAQVSVTFNVDMSVQVAEQQFNPATSMFTSEVV